MKAYRKALMMLMAKHFGYIIYSQEYKGMHFTLNYVSAYEWLLQYPEGTAVIVHRYKVLLTN